MPMFRKKPVVIEAVRVSWGTWNELCDFMPDVITAENGGRMVLTFSDTCDEHGPGYIELTIPTLEGDHIARHGDWIIKGVEGEFYACKDSIFRATYEPA